MSGGRITYLMEQLVAGVITPGEREELDQLILDAGLKGSFTRVLAEMMEANKTGPEWKGEHLERMVNNILSADRTGAPVDRRAGKVFSIRRWAAAAAVLILVAGFYFLSVKRPSQQIAHIQEEHYKNDVLPGGNKATLTLGNGKQIILDSAANGTLAQQGNTNIIKTDSSRLAYQIVKEKPTQIAFNVLTTPKGGQFQLTLPDGSKVWLNAASSIKYPTAFTGKERIVEITGEAYFEVAHNSMMPFKVKTANALIEDLGTHFNINAYPDEKYSRTTLLEGAVKITTGGESRELKPGEQAQIAGVSNEIAVLHDVDIEQAVAWKEAKFIFNQEELPVIMRELQRWYDVDIEFRGVAPAGHYSGVISRNKNASQVLNMLRMTGDIQFEIDGRKIIVLPKK